MGTVLDFYNEYHNGDWVGHDILKDITDRYDIKACLKMTEEKQVYLMTSKTDFKKYILKALAVNCHESLEDEYKLTRELSHPGIVAASEYIKGTDYNYLIREYVEGNTVTELVEMTEEGYLPKEELLEITVQLCNILHCLHSQKPPIIHRDIKPDNIIITKKKECKLIDFGISRRYSGNVDSDTFVMGSQFSAPPEQYGFAQTNERSDIYAIGILMFYMATGSLDIREIKHYQIQGDILIIIKKCTCFAPKDRYTSVKQLRKKLISYPYLYKKRRMLVAGIASIAILSLITGISICLPDSPEANEIIQVQAPVFEEEKVYEFKSPLIEASVREILGKSATASITYHDLEQITSLFICGQQRYNRWEEHFVYGVNQYMNGSQYTDKKLFTMNGEITNLDDITHMVNLEKLALYNQKISDLTPIQELHYLTYLGLGSNNISDMTQVVPMKSLNYLDISNNPIMNDDLEVLKELPYLWGLDLGATKITSVYGIKDLKLNFLSLYECKMGDCIGLDEITTLDNLILTGVNNAITDRAIDRVTKLTNLKILKIFGSGNIDLSRLATLKSMYLLDLCGMQDSCNLQGLNNPMLSQLYIDVWQKLDLTGIEKLSGVEVISLRDSVCSDYSPLLGAKNLKKVYCNQEQKNAIMTQLGEVQFDIIAQ